MSGLGIAALQNRRRSETSMEWMHRVRETFAHIRWREWGGIGARGWEIRLTQRENENEGRDVSTIDHRGSECNANHALPHPILFPIPSFHFRQHSPHPTTLLPALFRRYTSCLLLPIHPYIDIYTIVYILFQPRVHVQFNSLSVLRSQSSLWAPSLCCSVTRSQQDIDSDTPRGTHPLDPFQHFQRRQVHHPLILIYTNTHTINQTF